MPEARAPTAIIHVVLVSDQVLQNLIPVLMEQPRQVFLVITPEMSRRRADQRLRRQFRQAGAEVTDCGDCPDTEFPRIQAFAHQVAEQVINTGADADAEIVLNATGGNKLISIAFVEAFRGIATRILYTDTAHRRIEYLPAARDTQAPVATPMTDVLDVPSYLRAQGFQFRAAVSDGAAWQQRASARKAAAKFLGRHIGDVQLQSFVGHLNRLAGMALEPVPDTYEERLVAPEQRFNTVPRGRWAEALHALTQADILEWKPGSEDVRFRDADAAQFARGGWLEEYAYHVVRDAGVHDARLGVNGVWDNEQSMANEFDVLACQLNQLLFIECKTLRYRDQNDNQIAYKLDSLGEDARGLFGRTWLLSAREPTDTLIARARRARIRLVPPAELARLRELVREWRG